jgi:predicted O-linked N-acetylglucosamine transferase (SPINDLY family)
MQKPRTPELRLLLACARAHPTAENDEEIRQQLNEGADWTLFARKAIDHGLAGLAGHTLARAARDLVPSEILDAFQTLVTQTRTTNRTLLNELARLMEALAIAGVETIPFKGPVLAQQAFGDLGLRGFRDLDFLIHDRDLTQTVKTLCSLGYERKGDLTEEQFNLIHRLQGQEIMFQRDVAAIEPHTRLTSIKMVLDIDYAGLWRRATRENIFGREMLTFSPEDTLLVLAIHGGKELWWDIKWACDIADFISSKPQLDWNAIVTRAKAQGCYRMLLVATSLARGYFGAKIPTSIVAAEARDPALEQIIGRIVTRWEAEDPGGPPSNKTLSMDRLRLHDGIIRRASYVVRTLFLPGPQHIPLIALPRFLNFTYIPIGIAHDLIALPLYRAYQHLLPFIDDIRDYLAVSRVALVLAPVSAETRKGWKRFQLARLKAFKELAANPANGVAWREMGEAWAGLKRYRKAIACYDKALALTPDNDATWKRRHVAFAALKSSAGYADLKEAPSVEGQNANGWAIRAGFLSATKRHMDAAEASKRALLLDPEHVAAMRIGINSRLFGCDWREFEADKQLVAEKAISGVQTIRPFLHRAISGSEEENLLVAKLWARGYPRSNEPLWRGERCRHDRIRVAYISTDLRTHPVGAIMVGPIEQHDRTRFEITAVSIGSDDGGDVRRRIAAAVDRFIDAQAMSDMEVAAMLRELEIDIAVDLNGLTGEKRHGILASRPAPIQVNYLGYPGTMAAPFIDYIIADHIVIPDENRGYYSEKVAYLPNTYLPYDRRRPIAEKNATRAEQGLPDEGFIFACFSNLYKIAPEIFDVWMRLLTAVDGSVLWLLASNPAAMHNLRRRAEANGISPERVIFAGHTKEAGDHLARHRLADLFLDTLPYNAHSTCSDALWTGLPVLTCLGKAFPGRVAASLLYATSLPELVTTSLPEYEARALALAHAPGQLTAIREKLARNRETALLFDTARFTRDLESVYTTMWERQQAGLPPESF